MAGQNLRCTFCRRDQSDVEKLIAGRDLFICDRCALRLSARLRDAGTTTAPDEAAAGAGVKASRLKRAPRCSFCNKTETKDRRFVEDSGRMVCSECLGVVMHILRMEGITPES